ncbi:hypothetical protein F4808DRAFT_344037 [Astrocystis sublimbata]|nr:hypothetical protein F4808DRAFT_344037 [Astrocystis sublimbata]
MLTLALAGIRHLQVENFGGVKPSSRSSSPERPQPRPSLWSVLKTPSIIAVAFASTMVDGSMNLFGFYWLPTLSSLRQVSASELPYGTIFSSMMAASMAAALAFNIVMDRQMFSYSRLAAGILSVAAFCSSSLAAGERTEGATFWLFCLLQACVGVLTPCIGVLKGRLIEDDARTTVYSVMRTPFNILAVVSLLAVKDNSNVDGVFTTCALMLVASLAVMWAASSRGMP